MYDIHFLAPSPLNWLENCPAQSVQCTKPQHDYGNARLSLTLVYIAYTLRTISPLCYKLFLNNAHAVWCRLTNVFHPRGVSSLCYGAFLNKLYLLQITFSKKTKSLSSLTNIISLTIRVGYFFKVCHSEYMPCWKSLSARLPGVQVYIYPKKTCHTYLTWDWVVESEEDCVL